MKNILFLLILTIPFLCHSQNYDSTKDCRDFTIKSLTMVYRNEVNFYVKDNNLNCDAEFALNVPYSKMGDYNKYNKILENKSKDYVYDVIAVMNKSGAFNNTEYFDCKFVLYNFNIVYSTTDYQKITYRFYATDSDIMRIKDYINKQDVFLILKTF